MGKRVGIALGLLLGIGIAYEVVTIGPGGMGVTVSRHRSHRGSAAVPNIANNIITADKVGNWWILNQSGLMTSGSSLTLAGQASPGVSPISLNGTTQFFVSSSTPAFPAGDFSVVCSVNLSDFSTDQAIVAKWKTSHLVFELFINNTTGRPSFLVQDTGGNLGEADNTTALTAATWQAVSATYVSLTGVLTIRTAGHNNAATNAAGGVIPDTTEHSVGAQETGSAPAHMKSRGCFFTESELSTARQDAIMAGVL